MNIHQLSGTMDRLVTSLVKKYYGHRDKISLIKMASDPHLKSITINFHRDNDPVDHAEHDDECLG